MPARREPHAQREREAGVYYLQTAARVGGSGLEFSEVPEILSGAARAEWVRLGVVFAAAAPTRFREGDRAVLTAYCATWGLYVSTLAEIGAQGVLVQGRSESDRNRSVKNPALVALSQTGNQLRYLARELGLTPDARGRMGLHDESDESEDPIWG